MVAGKDIQLYSSIKSDKANPSLFGDYLLMVEHGAVKSIIDYIRTLPYQSEEYKAEKRKLPVLRATPQSRLMIFDFDHKDNPTKTAQSIKSLVSSNPSTLAAIFSAGGRGVTFFELFDYPEEMDNNTFTLIYEKRRKQLEKAYSIKLDEHFKTRKQPLFLSYDHSPYIVDFAEYIPVSIDKVSIQPKPTKSAYKLKESALIADNKIKLDNLISALKRKGKTITSTYNDFIKIGFALVNDLPYPSALDYFHKFASLDARYDFDQSQERFEQICNRVEANQDKPHQRKAHLSSIFQLGNEVLGFRLVQKEYSLSSMMPAGKRATRERLAAIVRDFYRANGEQYQDTNYTRLDRLSYVYEVSKSTIKNDLQKLEKAGFIQRELVNPNSTDRTKKIKITPYCFSALMRYANGKNALSSELAQGQPIYNTCPLSNPINKPLDKVATKQPDRVVLSSSSSILKKEKRENKRAGLLPSIQKIEIMSKLKFNSRETQDNELAKIMTAPPEPTPRSKHEMDFYREMCTVIRNSFQEVRKGATISNAGVKAFLELTQDEVLHLHDHIDKIKAGQAFRYFVQDRCFMKYVNDKTIKNDTLTKEHTERWTKPKHPSLKVADLCYLLPDDRVPFKVPYFQGRQINTKAIPDNYVYKVTGSDKLYINSFANQSEYNHESK